MNTWARFITWSWQIQRDLFWIWPYNIIGSHLNRPSRWTVRFEFLKSFPWGVNNWFVCHPKCVFLRASPFLGIWSSVNTGWIWYLYSIPKRRLFTHPLCKVVWCNWKVTRGDVTSMASRIFIIGIQVCFYVICLGAWQCWSTHWFNASCLLYYLRWVTFSVGRIVHRLSKRICCKTDTVVCLKCLSKSGWVRSVTSIHFSARVRSGF